MSKCLLQESKRVRARVHGNNGPDRKLLPAFHLLGQIEDRWTFTSLKNLVVEQLLSHSPDYNDINNPETYQIAHACELKSYFPPEYRQLLLQEISHLKNEVPEEWEYNSYRTGTEEIGNLISGLVDPHFRSRIAVLPPSEELGWHIDTNTSYACRVNIMLHGQQKFMIKRGKDIEMQIMKPREIWFSNTGYSHSVKVIGDEPRIAVLFSCHHSAIKHLLP